MGRREGGRDGGDEKVLPTRERRSAQEGREEERDLHSLVGRHSPPSSFSESRDGRRRERGGEARHLSVHLTHVSSSASSINIVIVDIVVILEDTSNTNNDALRPARRRPARSAARWRRAALPHPPAHSLTHSLASLTHSHTDARVDDDVMMCVGGASGAAQLLFKAPSLVVFDSRCR